MAIVLALERLYDDVVARFAADGTVCRQAFGWREPARNVVGPRIVWVPGAPGGDAGSDAPPRSPGRNPRPLATFHERFHVIVSANDPTAPENERAQYRAVRLLYDAWRRAVYLAAHGTYTVESASWLGAARDITERRHGAALLVLCTIDSMVPDAALEGAPVDTRAELDVHELDIIEPLTVSPGDLP